jgi:hypothetical protein
MGYPKIKIFDRRLIERTIQNLDNYKGNFEFTHLINSLLTLIVLPHEYNKRGYLHINTSFLKEKVFRIKGISGFFIEREELTDENGSTYQQKRLTLKSNKFKIKNEKKLLLDELLRKLRNGITHHNIRPVRDNYIESQSENSYWKGVIIRNYPNDKDALGWNDKFTIEVYFSYEGLKTFSKFVANKYLKNIDNLNNQDCLLS